MSDPAAAFVKAFDDRDDARREYHRLRAVAGPGVVPTLSGSDGVVEHPSRAEGSGGTVPTSEPSDGELVLARAVCSLADVLHERGPLPEHEVRAIAAAAARALARVHDAGLVHGDIKPANLLLSGDGDLWLADFETAAEADGQPLRRYSPPRLPAGAPARPRTDVSALAISLIELATATVVDSQVSWRAADLRRLGCGPALSAEIAFLLSAENDASQAGPDARAVASMFERSQSGPLPTPASQPRRVDPTPTIDFMPARAARSRTPPVPPAPAPRRRMRRLIDRLGPPSARPDAQAPPETRSNR